jgi:signal transduction histidine kinase/HAMP domain-containing protein
MTWLSMLLAALLALQMLFMPYVFQARWVPGVAQHIRLLGVTYALAALGIGGEVARIGIRPWVGHTARILLISAFLIQGLARSTAANPGGTLVLAAIFAITLAAASLWPAREGLIFRFLFVLVTAGVGTVLTVSAVQAPESAAFPAWLGPLLGLAGLLLCLGFVPALRGRAAGWMPFLLAAAALGSFGVSASLAGSWTGASFYGVMALGSAVWGIFLRRPWQDRTARFRRRILTMSIALAVVPLCFMGAFAVYAVESLERAEGMEAVRSLALQAERHVRLLVRENPEVLRDATQITDALKDSLARQGASVSLLPLSEFPHAEGDALVDSREAAGLDHRRALTATVRLPDYNLAITVSRPSVITYAYARGLAQTCFLLAVLIALLAVAISLSITSRLAGRLTEVRDVALALSTRHFRARIRDAEQEDEVAGLTATVNEMAATLERYSAELTRLLALTDAALAHLTGADLLRELLWRVRDALSGDTAALLLLDTDGTNLRVAENIGLHVPDGIRIPMGRGFAGRIAATARPLIVDDLTQIEVVTSHLRDNSRSAVGVPLVTQGRVIGVVHVGSRELAHFTQEDARLLQLAADRIAPAIEHAELFAAERQARLEVEEKTREIQRLNADLERRVDERTAELVVANQELEAFSYSVSHDLRGPLRNIDGFSQALLEDCAPRLQPEEVDYLRRIQGGIRRMGQLIDALLQLSRVARHEVRRVTIDLSALARSIAGELQQSGAGPAVQVTVEDGMTVHGDPRLIRIILENLLSNAFKFAGKAAEPTVAVGRQVEDGVTTYYVLDNGVGFDMAYAGKLFRPFERLHSNAEFEGTGIGLATVRRIVQLHGGRVWADSAPGEGAVFYFTLP